MHKYILNFTALTPQGKKQFLCGVISRRYSIWWFPCQKYRIYTVYIWFWPTLQKCCVPHWALYAAACEALQVCTATKSVACATLSIVHCSLWGTASVHSHQKCCVCHVEHCTLQLVRHCKCAQPPKVLRVPRWALYAAACEALQVCTATKSVACATLSIVHCSLWGTASVHSHQKCCVCHVERCTLHTQITQDWEHSKNGENLISTCVAPCFAPCFSHRPRG